MKKIVKFEFSIYGGAYLSSDDTIQVAYTYVITRTPSRRRRLHHVTVDQFIICIVHLFSYSSHIGGTISSPFAATKEGLQLVELVCSRAETIPHRCAVQDLCHDCCSKNIVE